MMELEKRVSVCIDQQNRLKKSNEPDTKEIKALQVVKATWPTAATTKGLYLKNESW